MMTTAGLFSRGSVDRRMHKTICNILLSVVSWSWARGCPAAASNVGPLALLLGWLIHVNPIYITVVVHVCRMMLSYGEDRSAALSVVKRADMCPDVVALTSP